MPKYLGPNGIVTCRVAPITEDSFQIIDETNQPKVVIHLVITEGRHANESINFNIKFPAKGDEKYDEKHAAAIEKLKSCGWDGESLEDLSGIGDNLVDAKITSFDNEGKQIQYVARVGAVGKLGGRKSFFSAMGDEDESYGGFKVYE